MLLFEDLTYDNVRNRNIVVLDRCPVGVGLYLAPINRCVSCQHPQATSRGSSLVHFTNRAKPVRVNRRLPRRHFGGVSPDMSHLFDGNILTSDVSVKQRLVILAREFNDDILNGFLKLLVTDQAHIEIAGLTQPVSLADDYDWMLFERRDNASYSITWHRLSTARLRGSASSRKCQHDRSTYDSPNGSTLHFWSFRIPTSRTSLRKSQVQSKQPLKTQKASHFGHPRFSWLGCSTHRGP